MLKIEEKTAYWYDGKAYKTRLEAQKAEFNDLFQACEIQSRHLFSETYNVHSDSITDKKYWKTLRTKLEKFDDSIQTLLSLRETLLPLVEQETEQKIVQFRQEQEKKKEKPDWENPFSDEVA